MTTLEDLQGLRAVEVADVYKGARRAATLRRTPTGVEFAYAAEYLAADPSPVATTLPLSDEPVLTPAGAVPPFFAGLLPEGRRLTALREAVKTSLDDDLTLLLAVGADPIGDVAVVPHGAPARAPIPTLTWTAGSDVLFAELLEREGLERRGMAGVQSKASVAMITLPASAAGRDAILKLTPPEFPHLVENEAWFLTLARSAGLTVPRFEVVTDRAGETGLLVERFDRPLRDGRVDRLAVEDGAQVLGVYPADKYRVTTEEVASALAGQCRARPVAAREVLRLVLFAWLTGNGDLHAKNLSIVQTHGEWRIAPAYDLTSSLPYGDDTMALALAGRTHDLSRRAFWEFADAIDLPAPAATRAIDELLTATEPALAVFEAQAEPFTRPRNAEAVGQLRHRRRLLEP